MKQDHQTLARYLREEVGIREVTAHDLVSWLEKKETHWWETLDESWLARLYRYLHGQTAEHPRLKELPIIRLENGKHASAVAEAVFFPADNIHEKEDGTLIVENCPIARTGWQTYAIRDLPQQAAKELGIDVSWDVLTGRARPVWLMKRRRKLVEELAKRHWRHQDIARVLGRERSAIYNMLAFPGRP